MGEPTVGRDPSDDYEVLVNKGAIVIPIQGNASRRVAYNEKDEGTRTIVIEDEDGGRFTLNTTYEPPNE